MNFHKNNGSCFVVVCCAAASILLVNYIISRDHLHGTNVMNGYLNRRVVFNFFSDTKLKQNISDSESLPEIRRKANITLEDFLRSTNETTKRDKCDVRNFDLKATRFRISKNLTLGDLWQDVMQPVKPGGAYTPSDCEPRENVAIIIPYRDREKHLGILLHSLHPLLQNQQRSYMIFVIEMALPTQFNVGLLRNVGYVMAKRLGDFGCFVFHDVDLIPVNGKNIYKCRDVPVHLSSNNSKYTNGSPYDSYFGGVTMFSDQQFEVVNGYSNLYFGWGGEDDYLNIYWRLQSLGIGVHRPDKSLGIYFALSHDKDRFNPSNTRKSDLQKDTVARMGRDGLNSLKSTIKALEFRPLYTWVLVSVSEIEMNSGIP